MYKANLRTLITPSTVLLGHSLESDSRALQLSHARCINTALIFHPRGRPRKPGFKFVSTTLPRSLLELIGLSSFPFSTIFQRLCPSRESSRFTTGCTFSSSLETHCATTTTMSLRMGSSGDPDNATLRLSKFTLCQVVPTLRGSKP